jgi:hypothetical protein
MNFYANKLLSGLLKEFGLLNANFSSSKKVKDHISFNSSEYDLSLIEVENTSESHHDQSIDCKLNKEIDLSNDVFHEDNFEYVDIKTEECVNPIALQFKNKNIISLWHMTHRNNVENILKNGILSNTQAFNLTNPVDISNHGVQRRREAKDPFYNRKIHDYTPTYLNIKNPMLYVRKDMQDELCLIEVSLSALSEDNFIFTDGNAASRDTKFFNSLNDLENLPWDVLNASYWNNFEDGKRKRCAEVLIYPSIEPESIKKIYCYSDVTLQQLSSVNCTITKARNLFF